MTLLHRHKFENAYYMSKLVPFISVYSPSRKERYDAYRQNKCLIEFVDLTAVVNCRTFPHCDGGQRTYTRRVRVAMVQTAIIPPLIASDGLPKQYERLLPDLKAYIGELLAEPKYCGADCGFSEKGKESQCAIWGSYCQMELRHLLPIWQNRCSFADSATCPLMDAKERNIMPKPNAEDPVIKSFLKWEKEVRRGV